MTLEERAQAFQREYTALSEKYGLKHEAQLSANGNSSGITATPKLVLIPTQQITNAETQEESTPQ